jgi:hypothetical protein
VSVSYLLPSGGEVVSVVVVPLSQVGLGRQEPDRIELLPWTDSRTILKQEVLRLKP